MSEYPNLIRIKEVTFLSLVLLLAIGCNLPTRHVSIMISETGICTDYDKTTKTPINITDKFVSNAEKLVVYFYAETSIETTITYRWFFESKLIAELQAPLDKGYNFGWITPEGEFPVGKYEVQILADEIILTTISFQVTAS